MTKTRAKLEDPPEIMRRRLRAALREARSKKGLTQQAAADAVYWSLSKIIRIEQGAVSITPADLEALLKVYEVTDQHRVSDLVTMALGARKQPWADYKSVFSAAALTLFGSESAATVIKKYEPTFVPGLFQTPEYVRALLTGQGLGDDKDRLDLMINARVERQAMLRESNHPRLEFVLGEAVVSRCVGDEQIMLQQLERIKELASHPLIQLQILPFSVGAHPRMGGAFTVLEFGDDMDDLLYLENAGGETTTREDPRLIADYQQDFLKLQSLATAPEDLSRVIDEIADYRFKSAPPARVQRVASRTTNAAG